MESASSQREKGVGLDYLTEFQLASSSLMSGQSPMDQVFQTFTHLPNSASAQMAFQASQNTYGHLAGQQYTLTPSFMSDRYTYLHPSFVNEDYFSQQCPPSSTHMQGQPYSAALTSSTPPMPPPMQSPQLSPMLRAHSQSPQHATASMMLHSKPANSTRAAPANSPQSPAFNAQLHSPHQHYNSTLGGPPGYYTTSQCSQRNDPPVGNMHMTKILNNHTFNHTSQFSTGTHSQLPPSSQSSVRSLNNGSIRPGKESISSSQMKNSQPSNSRPTGRESNLTTLQQSLTSSYLSSLAHSLQQRPSVAGKSGTQGRFQPTMSMAPVRAQSAGSTSNTSFRKQSPSVSSSNKSPMAVNFEVNFPRSAFSEMALKVNRDKQLGPSSGMSSLQSNVYGRKQSAKEGSISVSNPYDVYSIFSLNCQPAREVVRGKPEAATRPARPEDRSAALSKEMTPINWYKSPLMASSYSSDIEAMQADIIMESMMPIRASKQTSVKESGSVQRPPKAQGQPPTAKPAHSGQLGSSSAPIQQSKTSQQPPSSGQISSISASKSAALAAIRIKQEQAESLVKNRPSRNGNDEAIAAPKAPERQSTVNSLNSSSLNGPHVIGTLPTQTYSTGPAKTKNFDIQKDCAIINRSAKPSNPILDLSSTPEIKDRSNPTIRDLSNNVREKISSTALNEKSNNKSDNFLQQQKPPQTHFFAANSLSDPPYQLKIGQQGNQQDKKQLSSMKKALDMWKAGQVVGRAPSKPKATDVSIPSSNMPNKTTAVNSVTNSKPSHVPVEKNSHSEATIKNGSVNADLVPDTVQSDAHKGVRTSQTALQSRYVILHGHKLVCLKSRNEASVLLCQFLSECFPDKGIGSVHNCIDRALRIKKRHLDHTHTTKMGSFLKKNGYTDQMVETIGLDDARRVYHYIYKLVCNTPTCIVEVSHEQVDLDSLSMPARSLRLKEMTTRVKKELAGIIENSGLRAALQSQPMNKIIDSGAKSPINFLGCLDSCGEMDTDGHSIGSDHTEVYGKKTDNEEDLILVEAIDNPNIITLTPGIPKAGGICNTVVGSVRYYQHNNENYLVVEDLCNIFGAPVFYHTVEEESFVLYSCSQEIADFLNSIQGTFPPLSSPQQSLIKEADVGSLIIEDGDNAGVQEERSGSMKRPICKQEKPDEYESTSKKLKVDRDMPASNGMSENENESSEQPQCESLRELTLVDRGAEETTALIFDQVSVELEPLKAAPANEQDSTTEENMPCIPETAQPIPEARPAISVENETTERSRSRDTKYSKYNNLRLRALKMGKMLLKTSANLAKDKGKRVATVEKLEVVKPCDSSDVIASSKDCSLPESTTQKLETSSKTIREILRTDAGEVDAESFNAPLDNAKEVFPSTVEIMPQCQKPDFEKACVDVTAPGLVVRQEAVDIAVVEEAISFEVDIREVAQASRSGDSSETAQASLSGEGSEAAQANHSSVNDSGQSEVVQRACDSSVYKAQSISSATAVSSSPCLPIKKSFDDLSIISSTSHGSLAACPSGQFCSIKSLCEGYNKLCFQNKSLLQFAHLLRKEMAANKEKAEKEIAAHREKAEKEIASNKEKTEKEIAAIKENAEKEIAANKEKADREIEKLQDIIQQLTSGFKNCDAEAPIMIDDFSILITKHFES